MRALRLGICSLALLVGGGWAVLRARDAEQASILVAESERLLEPGLERAPDLGRIEAARARARLSDAAALDSSARVHGLLDYATALEELQKGRLDDAGRALARARRGLGRDARIELLAAHLAVAVDDLPEARRRLAAALALAPADARVRHLLAELSVATAPAEALAGAEALVAEHPTVGAFYNLRGIAHEALGDDARARSDFDRALELDVVASAPCVNQARLLRRAGRHDEAEAAFDDALRRNPTDHDAWLGRGLSRVAQGDVEGGALDIERARSLAPGDPVPLVALGDVEVARGRFARAIELYEAAIVADSSDAVARLKLGNARMRAGDAPAAAEAYARATELSPELAAAHNGLGAARMALGDAAGAHAALERAAALDPNDPNPLLNLAALRRRSGDRSGASDAMAEALARGYAP